VKKILITGANSYIGTSFEKWVSRYPDKYKVDTVDMKDENWRVKVFTGYDAVFHVAGIAHSSTKPKYKDLYYKVNRDLAIETAQKARAEGVKQFIFMSSIMVYGESGGINKMKVITRDQIPTPANFYGDSKLQAEEGIKTLESDEFKVVILRPPMIYGKGSKGNFPKLSKLATKIALFPDIDNQRSMIYIDNFCEFIKLMIDNEERGLFFPQNAEYAKTSEIVRLIAQSHGKKIRLVKVFNWLLRIFSFGIVNKVFGNLVYDQSMSEYPKGNYRIWDLEESIKRTEKVNSAS